MYRQFFQVLSPALILVAIATNPVDAAPRDRPAPAAKTERGEKAAARGELLAEFDADKDGKLNAEERKAAQRARAKERSKRRKQPRGGAQIPQGNAPVDNAGVGALGQDALAGGAGQGGQSRSRSSGASRAKLLKRFDTNRDGRLDPDEMRSVRAALDNMEHRNAAGNPSDGSDLPAANANGNAPVTPIDIEAIKRARQERRRAVP